MIFFKRWLLKRLLKKTPPRNFNLGDPTNDYVSIEMHDDGDDIALVRAVRGSEAICWADLPNETESTRPINDVINSCLEFRVFKGRSFSRCDSLWSAYYFSCLWGVALFHARQSRYDRGLGEYRGRIEVLETAVLLRERIQRDLDRIENTLRVSDVMKELYGDMIANSIRQIDILDNVRMKLCSFLHSGEISTQEDQNIMREFVLNPAAYSTLAAYSADERRHRDNLKAQRNLSTATLLLALVALIQLINSLKLFS